MREASSDSLGARIRRSKLLKVPYILVVGDDDVEHTTVGVNERGQDDPQRGVPLDGFVARVRDGNKESHHFLADDKARAAFMAANLSAVMDDTDKVRLFRDDAIAGVRSTARALPAIADAVRDQLTVLADGGVRSGLDVLRMVALGAHGVLLGRAWAYALAAGGGSYVTNMLDTMKRELAAAMAMAGRTRIADVDRTVLDR